MDTISVIYNPNGDNKYARGFTCSWDIPSDAHISEIHNICRNLCRLLGYSDITIDEYFGERVFED